MPRTSKLNEVSDDDFKAKYTSLGGNFAALGREFGCSAPAVKGRVAKLGLGDAAPVPAKPRAQGSKGPATASPDLSALLVVERDKLLARAAQLDVAIKALAP